jgi:hypothetical protein
MSEKDKVLISLIAAILMAVAIALIIIGVNNGITQLKHNKCQDSCGIIISKIIDGQCYCANETGWCISEQKEGE